MALLLNNLGSYATIEAVWANHPEGGREGDYVTVGGSVYYWDKYSRCWVQSSVAPTPSGGSQLISGDLTVSGNLGVGGDAVINGTLTVNGVPITGGGGSGGSGQIVYKSIVFRRSASRPSTPYGGAFGNPVPTDWSDGIPGGDDPIWMTSRIFTSDAQPPQQDYWTTPALMSDTENMDVEFSPASTANVPAAPTESNKGTLWFDPINHPNAPWSEMNWMATNTKYLDSNGNAVWSGWKIILIKGEQGEEGTPGANGDGYRSIYTIAATAPATPSGENPRGWYSSVDSLTLTEGTALWMSERRCVSGTWGNWSSPVRISGFNGEDGVGTPGEDGTDIEFIYKQSNTLPGSGDTAPASVDEDDDVPSGWSDNPSGVDATHKYEWMCQRIKPAGNNESWGEWHGPFVWSAYGDKGMDGDGIEYIYRNDLSNVNAAIANPSYSYRVDQSGTTVTRQVNDYRGGVISVDSIWYPEDWDFDDTTLHFIGWAGGTYQNGEWIPAGWHDDPQGVNATNKEEYVSTRKRHNGVWSNWSAPALWATFSAEHTVTIGSDGYWYIDGVKQDVKAEGNDGTGVAIKGSVDYLTSAQATTNVEQITNPTSLQGLSLSGLVAGDCYVVEFVKYESNAWTIKGHIYVYNGGTSSTYTDNWKDLGQFRGEAGASSYMHLAWATNVVISSGSTTVTGFSLVNNTGDYDWMGIRVNDNPSDPNNPTEYDWNYIKGVDGANQEFVYLLTSSNTNPGVTTSHTDSQGYSASHSEFLPCSNDDYTHGKTKVAADGRAEYTDDPESVSKTWPYCWMSTRRTKADGTWDDFSTPALWAVFSESMPWIDTAGIEQVVIDCDGEGRPNSDPSISITAKLMYGSHQCYLTTSGCSVTENTVGYVMPSYSPTLNPRTANISYNIQEQGSGGGSQGRGSSYPVLESGAITITLTGTDQNGDARTATKVIPVVPNRDGAAGPSGPSLRFRGAWSATEQYVYDSSIRDCVKYNGSYWLLASASSGAYTNAPADGNSQWMSMGNAGVVASELLLAENGAFNLLSSNVINLFNGAVKTASINEDGNGSYVIYYQVAPYGKMMEFSAKGFIIYYHNDTDNTVAWTLGDRGDINKTETSDDWKPIRLKKLLPRETTEENINANTHYVLETYYQFIAGSGSQFSAYGGKIFKGCSTLNPSLETIIDSGNYTRQQDAVQDLGEGKWAVTTYPVSNGIIDFSDPTTHYGATI